MLRGCTCDIVVKGNSPPVNLFTIIGKLRVQIPIMPQPSVSGSQVSKAGQAVCVRRMSLLSPSLNHSDTRQSWPSCMQKKADNIFVRTCYVAEIKHEQQLEKTVCTCVSGC